MNARTVAQVAALVGIGTLVLGGCAVETGSEKTGSNSQASVVQPPPVVTITCGTPEQLQTTGNHFEQALSQLGCSWKYPYESTAYGAMFESRCPSNTWTYAFCPNDGGAVDYVDASTLVTYCWAGVQGQLNASVSYGSHGVCSNLKGNGEYFFVDFDPTCTGSGCNAIISIGRP